MKNLVNPKDVKSVRKPNGKVEREVQMLYAEFGVASDGLAYTNELDAMVTRLNAKFCETFTPASLYRLVVSMRKAGKLPKLRRKVETV